MADWICGREDFATPCAEWRARKPAAALEPACYALGHEDDKCNNQQAIDDLLGPRELPKQFWQYGKQRCTDDRTDYGPKAAYECHCKLGNLLQKSERAGHDKTHGQRIHPSTYRGEE